ncbi:hypothetical protein J3E64_001157 [Sphingobium sp. OAS761]|uniref:hypothetical protein n=1 Tax=Sphingobium sp. OAS761 TaxID=2817901 RepID=UPI00209EAF24|nr:hypothetical protein [Sphingobium sp. OAS761]MCP1469482.1 hypothetical protein [Sphingobium sp. OAS761]
MAYPFGDRNSMAASGREDAFALENAALASAAEAAIREGGRSFVATPMGLILELRGHLWDGLTNRERGLLEQTEALLARMDLRQEVVRAEPARLWGYVRVLDTAGLDDGTLLAGNATTPAARTITARIVQTRREAGAVVPNAIKLVAHMTSAGIVVAIEIVLFHSALNIALEPVLGSPTQAMSNGILALVCFTAIIGGAWSFQDAGERTKSLIRKASRVAIGCFLAGSAAFVGNAIFRSLYDSASAANFDVTDTGGIGFFGSLGLALVFGSAGLLAWVGSHHSLGRIRELFGQLSKSLSLRADAARLEREHLADTAALVSRQNELEAVRRDLADIDLITARRVSALCAGSIAAGHKLLTQLDLYGAPKPNLIPDPLTEEALSYDRDVLRKKIERLEESSEPSAIYSRIRAALSPAKGKTK